MGQPFSYDFFPGVHHMNPHGPPTATPCMDTADFANATSTQLPGAIDPLRVNAPDQLGVAQNFIQHSVAPSIVSTALSVPDEATVAASMSSVPSSHPGAQGLMLPASDITLPPTERFLSCLVKNPRFRHSLEETAAPVW